MKGLLELRFSITLWFLHKELVFLYKNTWLQIFCKTRKLKEKSLKWQGRSGKKCAKLKLEFFFKS